jgi:FtsP/CotA-like multicopper oxidase with cupredoxin domain
MRYLLVCLSALAGSGPPGPANLPVVEANDNRTPAGTLTDGVLRLDLVVTMARWYPEDSGGSYTDIPVFAEVGKRPEIPGPLIRVPVGTELRISLRNDLPDSGLTLFGFQSRPATAPEQIVVRPGETRAITFRVDVPGTFLYAARSAAIPPRGRRETEQLAGALIVDPPGGRTDDRVWVMNIWSLRQPDGRLREALAINGKSWPWTERFEATVGDTVRWRVLNGSRRAHPMHLHGFFFSVDSRGTGLTDTLYTEAERRTVVTETTLGRQTMTMTWVPEEPGNWLFHCHLTFHVDAEARLDPPEAHHASSSGDMSEHMAGLVLGIQVRPRPGDVPVARVNPRKVSVHVLQGPAPADTSLPAPISFLLPRNSREPAASDVRVPGDMLLLTRGEPTDVTVHNRLSEPTSIHWHGLELESWSDGVPGWSGHGSTIAPPIAPGDSLTARLSLRRAGTFIYHTHLNDVEQITAGLYGPLIVLEPGQAWDPTRDFVFTGGLNGKPFPNLVVNGVREEPPLELVAGETYRFRFINITPAGAYSFQIRRNGELASWRPIAKDGADLPAHQAVPGPALMRIFNGETFDAAFTPAEPGTYLLFAPAIDTLKFYQRQLIVR